MKTRSKQTMSYEKRNGKYLVRWRDSSGKQRSKTVTLWRDAVSLDGEMKRKLAMGELITHERGTIRLCDFWDVWLERYGGVHLTSRSADIYKRLYSRHILPSIGNVWLRDLTREQVEILTHKLTATLSPSSVRKVLAILQGVLQRAVEWEYIPTNPVRGVKRPPLLQRRGQTITEEELTALCKELDLRSRVIVQMLAYTGLRPGELRALRWSDLSKQAIRVEHAISGDEVRSTKTGKGRIVPLHPKALKVLAEWRLAAERPNFERFVFTGRLRGVWTDAAWNHWQQDVFTSAASRAGISGLVPYDLRHTAISAMIASGMDPARVARIAGHSLQTLLSTYAHEFELVYSERHANLDTWQIPSSSRGFSASG
jgi:integrase